ncbi:DUF397 domain-containing protein [Actinacidiphila paucisporea]|uniref:DUF397 domain-containing protein n=1 Tax=Actinacidiphila paucisporea TaxID=310782 RepID=A0A1M7IRA6_9ACTN|nr:DUF397 domain-containing protein [Actinacidiphila paucisporea]SHM43219.1 protein of unknown function [Actinacidiphila paucisporea]
MTGHDHREDQGKPLMGTGGPGGLAVAWRKSSYSNHQSACVEVSEIGRESIGFRDSKDPEGAVLTFERTAAAAFVAAVAAGEFTEGR